MTDEIEPKFKLGEEVDFEGTNGFPYRGQIYAVFFGSTSSCINQFTGEINKDISISHRWCDPIIPSAHTLGGYSYHIYTSMPYGMQKNIPEHDIWKLGDKSTRSTKDALDQKSQMEDLLENFSAFSKTFVKFEKIIKEIKDLTK